MHGSRHRRTTWRSVRLAVAAVLAATLAITSQSAAVGTVQAGGAGRAGTTINAAGAEVQTVAALGNNWWKSTDLAITATADRNGYHVYAGYAAQAFAWLPLATIRPAGFDAGSWTGYSCLTGSGRHVVAVVAPASFANSPLLRDRGAVAYVVDVPTGQVHPLVAGVALKYYSPGCGAADTVTLTRNLGSDSQSTQLLRIDAATATVAATVTLKGQYTSAVPDGAGFVAAFGSALVHISADGVVERLAGAAGQIYDIVARDHTSVDFLAADGGQAQAYRWTKNRLSHTAVGGVTGTRLFPGRAGRSILVSATPSTSANAADVVVRGALATTQATSLEGTLTLATGRDGRLQVRAARNGAILVGRAELGPAARATTALPPVGFALRSATIAPLSAPRSALPLATGSPTCAAPRNDPTVQVPQPDRPQVQRAVDLAVHDNLRDTRPAGYLQMGLPAYSANGDFPAETLAGGGTVPAQVFLGILAQESNLNQASWHALPGIAANPLVGDFYGSGDTLDFIDYANADCGYGVSQITTGMRTADVSPYSANGKRKIAVDYEENIAAGLNVLQEKWNQLYAAGIIANNGRSQYIENWYFAIWAYNTGVQPDANHGNTTGCTPSYSCHDSAGNWGLGWANNPVNPDYPPGRPSFLRTTYADAAHPSDWPYQERVLGWIETPQLDFDGNNSYSPPAYADDSPIVDGYYVLNLPPVTQFCSGLNNCNPEAQGNQYCSYSDPASSLYLHCWWHMPSTWVADCTVHCASELPVYSAGAADPGVVNPHPADCNSSLPTSTKIIDELPNPAQNIAGCGTRNWSTTGSFTLTYGTDAAGDPVAQIDTHQLGAGFGGHLYFTHNVATSDAAHKVTGTWQAPLATHLYNVLAHMPSTGGTTNSAKYRVTAADGSVTTRSLNQDTSEDEWASIGYFNLGANAKVELDNMTADANGNHDVAFDAVAFVPVSGTLQHHTFDAVSIFRSNQNLDTTTPSQFNTPLRNMQSLYDWGRERTVGGAPWDNPSQPAKTGIARIPVCGPGQTPPFCVGRATQQAVQRWSQDVLAAGTSTTGSVTEADWMGFAVASPNPAVPPDQAFADDLSFKIKTHVDVQYAVSSGKVIPGSQAVSVTNRTGNTHVAQFVIDFMNAVNTDYGVPVPDLSYSEIDANTYTGDYTWVSNPLATGHMPGMAYMPHLKAPTIDTTGKCVQARNITGGSIGYRPLVAQDQTDARVLAWATAIQNLTFDTVVPSEVSEFAFDIYNTFFRGMGLVNGSLFNVAPPIWQQVSMQFCLNGTVSSTQTVINPDDNPNHGLVYQSYMPSLYLYFDGAMVDNLGHPATGPVQNGNFGEFSNLPLPPHDADNAYSNCNISQRGNGGNPWNIGVPPFTGASERPRRVRFCDDLSVFMDTYAP